MMGLRFTIAPKLMLRSPHHDGDQLADLFILPVETYAFAEERRLFYVAIAAELGIAGG